MPSIEDVGQVRKALENGFGWKINSKNLANYLVDCIIEVDEDETGYSNEDKKMLLCNLVSIVKTMQY